MKNSNDTIWNRTSDLNHCATAVPRVNKTTNINGILRYGAQILIITAEWFTLKTVPINSITSS